MQGKTGKPCHLPVGIFDRCKGPGSPRIYPEQKTVGLLKTRPQARNAQGHRTNSIAEVLLFSRSSPLTKAYIEDTTNNPSLSSLSLLLCLGNASPKAMRICRALEFRPVRSSVTLCIFRPLRRRTLKRSWNFGSCASLARYFLRPPCQMRTSLNRSP